MRAGSDLVIYLYRVVVMRADSDLVSCVMLLWCEPTVILVSSLCRVVVMRADSNFSKLSVSCCCDACWQWFGADWLRSMVVQWQRIWTSVHSLRSLMAIHPAWCLTSARPSSARDASNYWIRNLCRRSSSSVHSHDLTPSLRTSRKLTRFANLSLLIWIREREQIKLCHVLSFFVHLLSHHLITKFCSYYIRINYICFYCVFEGFSVVFVVFENFSIVFV